MIGIYKITSPTNKIYIGQSSNIENRKNFYKREYCKAQIKLHNSIQKYGWKNHKFELIEECSLEQLNEKEIYWGKYYDVLGENGLNLKLGNANGLVSEEVKKKIGKARLGQKDSEETKLKKSKSAKGKKKTKTHKENLQNHTSNIAVIQYDLDMYTIAEYKSINEASRQTGIDKNRISACCYDKIENTGDWIWGFK